MIEFLSYIGYKIIIQFEVTDFSTEIKQHLNIEQLTAD